MIRDREPAKKHSQTDQAPAERLYSGASELLRHLHAVEERSVEAYQAERDRVVREQLARMPLEKLRDASEGRLRLQAIEAVGLRTVGAVIAIGRHRLESIPGVGVKTSTQIIAGAQQIESALRNETHIRFDVDMKLQEQTELLAVLRDYEIAHKLIDPLKEQLDNIVEMVDASFNPAQLKAGTTYLILSPSGIKREREARRAALGRLAQLANSPEATDLLLKIMSVQQGLSQVPKPQGVWDDYITRPVVYNGLLIKVGGRHHSNDMSRGIIPKDIAEKIRSFELDTQLLRTSLRGYQSFGSKYALVQGRAILGDEMGLGKTIQALAMFSHLWAYGKCFLIVGPASVMAHWEHEIDQHTKIPSKWVFRLHGDERDRLLHKWSRLGGIAITTFDTLPTLKIPKIQIEAVVVDEAQKVKNPYTKRTKAARSWLSLSKQSLLMSGTPMENRVEEFRNLIDHVRPDISATISPTLGIAGVDAFRKSVAQVYLRRNQEDVLDELPEKIEVAEWLSLDGPAADVYRSAVAEGKFMAMRRAAFLTKNPKDSPKLIRLLEITQEAADDGLKVVVFSFFHEVLNRIHNAICNIQGILAVGPLTGSVPAPERQRIVDDFSNHPNPAVLVAQIEAGGIGLNIQAASVVILAEPQWKPSSEDQAIRRCYRLGQVRHVVAHRLLTENSVDERMLELLAPKRNLFATYVRESYMKDTTPEAIDITYGEQTAKVATQAERERLIIDLERKRLKL